MITKTIISKIMIFFSLISLAQSEFPKGGYLSLSELVERKPTGDFVLEISARTGGDITMMGGNDFKLESKDKSIKKKFIKKELWAYADDSALYVNGFKFECQLWYGKVINIEGSKIQFRGAMSNADVKIMTSLGAVGGAASGAAAARRRYIHEIDLKTGKIRKIKEIEFSPADKD